MPVLSKAHPTQLVKRELIFKKEKCIIDVKEKSRTCKEDRKLEFILIEDFRHSYN